MLGKLLLLSKSYHGSNYFLGVWNSQFIYQHFLEITDGEMSKHKHLLFMEPAVRIFILEALRDDLPLSVIFHSFAEFY